jgi:D-sedoheptulose 7-phosphate isomerase
MKTLIQKQIQESIRVKQKILEDSELQSTLNHFCELCVSAYKNGKKLLIAGNGGSAADAQHIAGELVSKFYFDRPALPAIALTTDTSILTAIGNDYGYENLFSRQIEANGVEGDIFLGISTSGKSPNIIKGIEVAKLKGIICIGMTGSNDSEMKKKADYVIKVPSDDTPRIQEAHILIGHLICCYIEQAIFS